MDTPLKLQIVEILVAVGALIYGIFEHYKRQKIEKILKIITRTYPGDVAKIEQSCTWAWTNVRDAHKQAIKIPDCDQKEQILVFLGNALGDTGASARMCSGLFNQLLGFQEAQFNTRIISHPEKDTLALSQLEAKNLNVTIKPASSK